MNVVTRDPLVYSRTGLAPGELVPAAAGIAGETRIQLVTFTSEQYEVQDNVSVEDCARMRGAVPVVWVHLIGLADVDKLQGIAEAFGIHSLAVEDIANNHARPQFTEFDDALFCVGKAVSHVDAETVLIEHMAFYLAENFIVSAQESGIDHFEPLRRRLARPSGRIRHRRASYLLFALLDVVTDLVMDVLVQLDDEIFAIEERVAPRASDDTERDAQLPLEEIFHLRRASLRLARAVLPLREVASRLESLDHELIEEDDGYFYRDLADSARRAVERLEGSRAVLQTLQEYSHTQQMMRRDQVIKTLTIFSTLFLPLTFIAGVYGMNFDHEVSPWNMPELYTRYGYPATMSVMALFFFGMIWWFKRKGWF